MNTPETRLPRALVSLLRLIVHPDRIDDVVDDLERLSAKRMHRGTSGSALKNRRRLWRDVISICLLPSMWRKRSVSSQIENSFSLNSTMLKFDLRFAIRSMLKRAGFTTLNAAGFGVGLANIKMHTHKIQ